VSLAAVVWHWWIAPLLLGGGLLVFAATVVGYLKQVVQPRFPPKGYVPPTSLESSPTPEAVEGSPQPAALGEGAEVEASS